MSKNIEKREIIMFKKTLKRAMSLLLVAVLVVSAIPTLSIATTAAFNRSTDIIYSQTSSVTVGKIRYVAQQNSSGADFSDYFYPGYWYNGNAKQGCFVASTSMALSYMGVNMTPKVMYEKGLISNYTSSWNNLAASTTVASKASSYSGISVSSIYTGTVVTSFSTLDTAINNFQNGNGMYSPPIVWTKGSNGGTHYFLVTKKISSNLYEMVDPISEDNKQVNLVSYATNIVYGNGGTAKGQLSDVIQYKRNTALPSASYTITYNANGGSGAPSSQTHSSGATHTVKSTIPTRFGYTFVGWGTSSSATSGYLPGQTFTVTGNRTLYAIWQSAYNCNTSTGRANYNANIIAPGHCKYYTITLADTRKYHIESTGDIDSKITIYNSSGTELISDDDAGSDFNFSLNYTFQRGQKYYIKIHAYNDNKGTIPFTMRVYYNITYNANGGSGAPSSQEKLYGENIYLSSTIPQRSGYTFLGWATSANATSAQYSAGDLLSENGNVTLYAVWRQNAPTTYTVSYSANGGSGAPSSQTHTSGAAHTVTSTIPTRFGYTFVGWGTTSSATSGYLPGQSFSVTSNRTLYAIWQTAVSFSSTHQTGGYSANIIAPDHCRYYTITPSYTRKYRIESTGSIDSKVTIYNASGTELTSDDDTGNENNFSLNYTFQSGQKYYIKIHAYGEDTGSIPFTMKAIWNITYNANGGSGAPSSQEKLYGQNVYLSSTIPQRSGYTFLGWATSANATSAQYSAGATYSAESNVTLYAVWRQNAVATVPATPKVTGVNTLKGIDIKWNSIPGAVKYVVYKRLGTSSTWDIVATTTATSYSDTNAPSAGSYYIYSVKAYNSANTSSNYEKAKTAVIQRVVAPYTKATNATNGINVTWGTVAGANKYIVLRRIGTESTWRIIGETTGTSFRDTNVNVGIYYIYSIRAVNGTGYSAYDINKRFTIQYITAPTAVATNIIDGVNISWSGVRGATKYAVYRRQGGYSTWYLVGYTQGTSIRDYDVENGIYYVYSVRAYNGSGYSAYNGSKTDTIQPLEAPYASLQNVYNGVRISWLSASGAKKYNVYRRNAGSSTWSLVGTTTGTSITDQNVVVGRYYAYSVRAINGTGYSAYDANKAKSVRCSRIADNLGVYTKYAELHKNEFYKEFPCIGGAGDGWGCWWSECQGDVILGYSPMYDTCNCVMLPLYKIFPGTASYKTMTRQQLSSYLGVSVNYYYPTETDEINTDVVKEVMIFRYNGTLITIYCSSYNSVNVFDDSCVVSFIK